jgi:carboxypeptidase Q
MRRWFAGSLLVLTSFGPLQAAGREEEVDLGMMTRIREEGFTNSQVMETAEELSDVLGPRLTGSPKLKEANEWTRSQLASWGLSNAHLDPWGPFGRGWSLEHVSVDMVAPSRTPLIAIPKAWTPGTSGAVRGKVVQATLKEQGDLDKNKGKLAGAIVFLSAARDLAAPDKALFKRYSDNELTDLSHFEATERNRFNREEFLQRQRFQKKLNAWLAEEKVLAVVEPSERDGGVVRVAGGGSRVSGEQTGPPALVMAAEHYNRIMRLLEEKKEVELELNVQATFHDGDTMAYNTIAEIPGTDKAGEVVMLGAHLDSWHSGTGATDNAAGCAVVMEAVRILKALGVKPRRTIRVALWTGEEQGLLGSRAYVQEHVASRPEPKDDEERLLGLGRMRGPITPRPQHAKISAYFNLDNGTGKVRGVYTQRNSAALPIFTAWLEPLHDLGAVTVTNRSTGGTDHLSFDGVGVPGFQFIQDQADYATRTHHTNMDVFDRLQKDDLMQASVVMAAFVYDAAMRPEMFPRKPMPVDRPEPSPSPSPSASPSPSPATPDPAPSPR